MKWMLIGTDPRFAPLSELAAEQGIDAAAPARGLDADGWRAAAAQADALIAHSPWGAGQLPSADCPLSAGQLMDAARPDARLIALSCAGMPAAYRRDHGGRTIDLGTDEAFAVRNGALTAEGAVFTAMVRSSSALCEGICLVIGYGRVGRPLALMLAGLGSRVLVAARRPEVRSQVENDRAATPIRAISMDGLWDALPGAGFVFTTPPETVLDAALLGRLRPGALLIDLASPPYGFDMALAAGMGIACSREPALPGRYCPRSAAAALLDAALRAITAKGEET
ncbi:MAG: hypothetical protein GX558_07470 [Clostridiales bacterium]|nr:hypothetical protein [Clostridiales bacterium]